MLRGAARLGGRRFAAGPFIINVGSLGFPCSWEAALEGELRYSASRFLPEGTRYRTQTVPCALSVGWGLGGL